MTEQTNREEENARPVQAALFDLGAGGRLRGNVGIVPDLSATSSLDVARYWYRRHLEQSGHPRNTVNSYSYDLSIFELLIGPKAIGEIKRRDIAHFLDDSKTKSTRKRRLTSLSGLFKFLVHRVHVLENDPTEEFYPEHIPLKTPRPLFADEQERLLQAAVEDGPRAAAAIWLMLRLGLSRAELLALRAEHIDFSDPERPVVYIYYDNPRHRGRERRLAADAEFTALYQRLQEQLGPLDRLFEILPQSVNKMVERITQAAGLNRHVSPQNLRDTFAVERARESADEEDLLRLLGLADDARNRTSVQRYLKLAEPPLLSGDGKETASAPESSPD